MAAAERLRLRPASTRRQWATLAKITALTGTPPDAIGPAEFTQARTAIVDAVLARRSANAAKSVAAAFYRLQLTLFHAGRLETYTRAQRRVPVSVRGWAVVAPGVTESARRYLAQVALSLRPSTVAHIEHDLRQFGTRLAEAHPEVASCADLARPHIEQFKAWLAGRGGLRTGKPLSRSCIKTRLIDLHCFFDRITEWGYPNAPQRPLMFAGDLPILDKPLPRFLDDGAAAKLLRAARADADPLARVIVELLARTGMRLGELRALTIDAVVQIGSAYWLGSRSASSTTTGTSLCTRSSRSSWTTGSSTTGPPGCAPTGSCSPVTVRSPRGASPWRCTGSAPRRGSGPSPRTSSGTPSPRKPSIAG